jgi:hypothetical protein
MPRELFDEFVMSNGCSIQSLLLPVLTLSYVRANVSSLLLPTPLKLILRLPLGGLWLSGFSSVGANIMSISPAS